MGQIMESVLCVQYTEKPRIRDIQQAVDTKEGPSYNAFVKTSKQKTSAKKRSAQEEAEGAKVNRKELGLNEGVDNLKALIQGRQKDRQKLKWVIFWLRWNQNSANLPKEEGKDQLSRKKRNNGIFLFKGP